MKTRAILFLTLALFISVSCRKKDPPAVANENKGKISLYFSSVAGDEPLVLNTGVYTNAHGDSFSVTAYAYYISNITLSADDGGSFSEPESYHLISEAADTSRSFTIGNIPEGTYTSLKFLIGVDEVRNTSGAQTGALDPMHSMFWDWNTGYIMAKLEGHSPQSPGPDNMIGFHLGGFSGPESVLRWVTLELPEPIRITTGTIPEIQIKSNLVTWFGPSNIIDFSETYILMGAGEISAKIADNYKDMFTISRIQK